MKKYKGYSEYKDSGVEWIGEIPGHWQSVKLKYFGEVKSGDSIDSNQIEPEGDYPVYGGNGIMGYYSGFNLNIPVLIIGRVGEKCGNIHYSDEKVFINDNALIFTPQNNNAILHYLFYVLKRRDLNQLRNKNTQPLITGTLVKNEYCPLPPLPEQHQIVRFLDTKTTLIDTLIEKTQRKIELLREKRTALINHTVTKGLNPNAKMKDSGVEWIGVVPEHWSISKFKYHSIIVTGNTPSKQFEDLYYTPKGTGYPWIKPSNLDKGFDYVLESDENLTQEGWNQTRPIPKDSIMICSIGNTLGKYGISGSKISTNQQINSVICDNITLSSRYCLFFADVLSRDLISWTNFVTLPIFTKSDLEDTFIIVPPIPEQHQIVQFLDEQTSIIDTTISKEERRIELLKEYRQALISEVVTGKIKVTSDE